MRRDLAEHGQDDEVPRAPILWPALTAEEAEVEWPALFGWVEQLRQRYPNGVRLPDCWYHHSDIVEALAALRDYERGSFAPTAPATAAVDWQRAHRDIEARLDTWCRRLPCAVPGRGHPTVPATRTLPSDWTDMVTADVAARRPLPPAAGGWAIPDA